MPHKKKAQLSPGPRSAHLKSETEYQDQSQPGIRRHTHEEVSGAPVARVTSSARNADYHTLSNAKVAPAPPAAPMRRMGQHQSGGRNLLIPNLTLQGRLQDSFYANHQTARPSQHFLGPPSNFRPPVQYPVYGRGARHGYYDESVLPYSSEPRPPITSNVMVRYRGAAASNTVKT